MASWRCGLTLKPPTGRCWPRSYTSPAALDTGKERLTTTLCRFTARGAVSLRLCLSSSTAQWRKTLRLPTLASSVRTWQACLWIMATDNLGLKICWNHMSRRRFKICGAMSSHKNDPPLRLCHISLKTDNVQWPRSNKLFRRCPAVDWNEM